MSADTTHTEEHHTGEHAHPGPGQYVKIAVILAIVTAIEVAAYYVTGIPDGVLSAALLIMMVVKFFFVGMWFMHLKFDSKVFRNLFMVGIVLALAVYTVVLVSFGLLLGGADRSSGGSGSHADLQTTPVASVAPQSTAPASTVEPAASPAAE
jgi:cytochrome c oxidase subunit IV